MQNKAIHIDEKELTFSYTPSSGPGGQNVNKVSTAVQLKYDLLHSKSLTEEVKSRLFQTEKNRISKEGILLIQASRHRTREMNKNDAIQRLLTIITKASVKKIKRIKTKPTKASKRRRLDNKKKKSQLKQGRKSKDFDF